MRTSPKAYVAVVLLALSTQGAARGTHAGTLFVTASQRASLIRRARVWQPMNVSAVDMTAGPQGLGGFPPGQTVTCRYRNERMNGATPKFSCTIEAEDHVKVRYGRANSEVYAGVAATRLLWALGFGADAMYPVKIVCQGCPPFAGGEAKADRVLFDIAAIERKWPGVDVEAPSAGTGWSWNELDLVDEREGGAPVAHRDALKLLAVLLQHTDSKAEQQRLVCTDRPDDVTHDKGDQHEKKERACGHPLMMVHDVGQTFGSANLFNRATVGSVNLEQWSRTPVWKDAARCIGNLAPSQTGTLTNPIVSEAGRKFLADLLARLTDRQLHDLFTVARFTDRPGSGGGSESSSVDQWVSAFKAKRAEISAARCE